MANTKADVAALAIKVSTDDAVLTTVSMGLKADGTILYCWHAVRWTTPEDQRNALVMLAKVTDLIASDLLPVHTEPARTLHLGGAGGTRPGMDGQAGASLAGGVGGKGGRGGAPGERGEDGQSGTDAFGGPGGEGGKHT